MAPLLQLESLEESRLAGAPLSLDWMMTLWLQAGVEVAPEPLMEVGWSAGAGQKVQG